MKAWSLAWNFAEIELDDNTIRIIQVRRTGKGCLSYIVGSGDAAVVIDPSVSANVNVDLVRHRGWTVRYVLETHIHADHLSRASEVLPDACRASATSAAAREVSLHSSGRRRSHPCGQCDSRSQTDARPHKREHGVRSERGGRLTGDTLFTKGVGRPDLHADPEALRQRARALFQSLTKLRQLPPEMLVLPAHASDPIAFDGRPVAAPLEEVSTWLSDWIASESRFVQRFTTNLPATPPNFARIVELNETGEFPSDDPTEPIDAS